MEDLVGKRFGMLLVKEFYTFKGTRPRPHWQCLCDCGGVHIVSSSNLKKGRVQSCGCLVRNGALKGNYKHGLHGTAVYSSWHAMMDRCYNAKSANYARYGGRGIQVCERWHDVRNFLEDVGHQPKRGMSIDRIDNGRNYEPENCRWTTANIQSNNRSTNRLHTIDGTTKTQAQWADSFGVKQPTVCMRLKRGWTIEEALGIHPKTQ